MIIFLLAAVVFAAGFIWLIIQAAANKPTKPPIAVILSSFVIAFIGFAACFAGI